MLMNLSVGRFGWKLTFFRGAWGGSADGFPRARFGEPAPTPVPYFSW